MFTNTNVLYLKDSYLVLKLSQIFLSLYLILILFLESSWWVDQGDRLWFRWQNHPGGIQIGSCRNSFNWGFLNVCLVHVCTCTYFTKEWKKRLNVILKSKWKHIWMKLSTYDILLLPIKIQNKDHILTFYVYCLWLWPVLPPVPSISNNWAEESNNHAKLLKCFR